MPGGVLARVTVLLLAVSAAAVQAAGPATVRGVEAVNVRRGPSADTAAIVSLRRGATVAVERVVDGWAAVTLPNGQQGFIKAAFLDLPPDIETAPAPEATPPLPNSPISEAESDPAARTDTPPRAELEHEVSQLRERLAALESAVIQPTTVPQAATPGPDVGAQREERPTRIAGLLPAGPVGSEPQELGSAFALAGIGMVVGFLIGTVYGRRQERARRSRVRF